MGKQINYWLGYEDFLKIAQAALDCGCIIIKKVSGKLVYGQTLDIVTEHEHYYQGKRFLLVTLMSKAIYPLEILL